MSGTGTIFHWQGAFSHHEDVRLNFGLTEYIGSFDINFRQHLTKFYELDIKNHFI